MCRVRSWPYATSSNRRYGRHYDVTASTTSHGYAGGKITACCLFVSAFVIVFVCPHDNFRTTKRRMMKLCGGELYKNLAEFECQGQTSRSSGTKSAHSAADTPRVRTNGMRLLQTACSSSGRAHFVAARGCCSVVSFASSTLVVKSAHAVQLKR